MKKLSFIKKKTKQDEEQLEDDLELIEDLDEGPKVVQLSYDYDDDDFDLIEDSSIKKVGKKARGFAIVFIFTAIVMALIIVAVSFLLNYKVVSAPIKDANFNVANFSVITNQCTPNLSTLKNGDKILYQENTQSDNSPFVLSYQIATVSSITGNIVYIDTEGTGKNLQKIPTGYIKYIIK